jgi:hypothetical protein
MSILESLRQFFIEKFNKEGEAALPFLCESGVSVMAFMAKYKDFPPIEELDPEEKTKMKKYAHEMFPGKTAEFKLRACKIIYVIGSML